LKGLDPRFCGEDVCGEDEIQARIVLRRRVGYDWRVRRLLAGPVRTGANVAATHPNRQESSIMYRMNILYPRRSDGRFEWDPYLRGHLPLAVGTSMRHSGVLKCDCDRPVPGDTGPFVAACIVSFDTHASLARFQQFLSSASEDTKRIEADMPNYTNLEPLFHAAEVQSLSGSDPGTEGYRIRVYYPAKDGCHFDGDYYVGTHFPLVVAQAREHGVRIQRLDFDRPLGALAPGSTSPFLGIGTIAVPARADANDLMALLESKRGRAVLDDIARYTNIAPQVQVSEVVDFDLGAARPYARG
jgi:uncharacterized protein (TIGR02118 family)